MGTFLYLNLDNGKAAAHPSPLLFPVHTEEAPTAFHVGRISVQLLVFNNYFIFATFVILRG